LGRVPEAIVVSRKAIELDPLSSNPWGQLGRMLNAVGQFAAARDALDRCLEISPESNRGLFHRGMTELLQAGPREAMPYFRKPAAATAAPAVPWRSIRSATRRPRSASSMQ
jgi:Flp pilus assembly protein TadD